MAEIIRSFTFLLLSLLLVIKSADFAIRYSGRLAESFRLPKYVIGFLLVAVISILPETFIAVTSALEGVPSFGLGTLFGSNVADLSLVFSLVILISGRNLKIEKKIIKNRFLYICMMVLPIILGLNGYYSALEGMTLIILGLMFYLYIFKDGELEMSVPKESFSSNSMILLIISMAGLLLGAHWTVESGVLFANLLHISPVLIGMFIVGLGTTLPELLFAIRAAKRKEYGLALGDILGTAIADATIVVGIMAVISPFSFPPRIIWITGIFMLLAIVILMHFMKTDRVITKKEAVLLVVFYLIFVTTELLLK